jgi:uncharacterized protein (TIGR00303 family)
MLAAGTTETATIDGISAAGASPEVMVQTPSADAELLAYGSPVHTGLVPVSPSGCPTPAMITRAVREVCGFEFATIDAGLAVPTAAPTIDVGAVPGADIREPTAVREATEIFEQGQALGASIPDEEFLVAETIPGGTTTAMGVLEALGEHSTVSSSLPENPIALKREVVEEALDASGLDPGDCAEDPISAIEAVGDPVLAAVAGLTTGAARRGADVTLAGGTQQLAAAALVRHAGVDEPLTVATTSYVAEDESAAVSDLASDLDVSLTVTDPGFAGQDHVAMDRFEAGEAKEGVGMGGALALAESADALAAVREQFRTIYDRLVEDVADIVESQTDDDDHDQEDRDAA